jgi:RNA polymerase sigma factor (sigma-70 family)
VTAATAPTSYSNGIDPAAHMGLAGHLVKRYRLPPGLERDDVLQAARLGIVLAAQRYDPSRGAPFASYAAWWVRGQILAAIQEHLRQPALLADLVGEDDEGRRAYQDLLHAPEGPDQDAAPDVAQLLRVLPRRRWRKVVSLRYGLDGKGERTREEVAQLMGVTKQRVCQILARALTRMRRTAHHTGRQAQTPTPRS